MPIKKTLTYVNRKDIVGFIYNFTCIAAIARANQPEALPMK